MSPLVLLLLALLGFLLVTAVVTDLRRRQIDNGLNAAVALLAVPWWFACGWGPAAMAWQVGLALVMLLLFAGAFALGMMGGGDVKLIAAVALWLPPGALLAMLWWMALGGGLLTVVMLLHHRIGRKEGAIEVPYGLAIAAATALVMTNHFLTNQGA